MKVSIFTNVVDGVIKRNRKPLKEAIEQFNGKEIVITIEKKKKKRSVLQNAFYWGVIIPIIQLAIKDSWGEKMTINEVHELLKKELNYIEKVNENTGEIIKLAQSTTTKSTTEWMEYEEDCRRWAFEWFNCEIPLPNEQVEIEIK